MPPALSFNRPYYTSPSKLVLAPLEIQKRLVLSKLRNAVPDPNEEFIKTESMRMKKARNWEEKQKRLEKERAMKEKNKVDALNAKRARQEEERVKQRANVNLKRGLKVAKVEERVANSRLTYNLEARQTMKGRREFREEMKRRREARKELEANNKAELKASLAERVEKMTDREERERVRIERLEEKKQEQERHAAEQHDFHRSRIEKMQKEAKERKIRIQEAKKELQSGRKQAWQAELLRKGKIERLNEKREKKIMELKKEWESTRNKVSLNRATFVSRLDSILQAASNQMEGGEGAWVERINNNSEDFVVNLDIQDASPLRSPVAARNRKRANTPVTPQDYFKVPDAEEETPEGAGGIAEVTDRSEETVRKSNVTPFKDGEKSFTFDDLASPTAEIDGQGAEEEEEEEEEEGHIFSPLDPAMKRGYSFTYTPSRVPDDAELERMSPLQRTYTAMKLSKGEDA
eukprot:CAMPEP_0118656434 /NCGR_PEP_ID=MMETSP0785-20121206/13487_1 /TAXON_ID=91992 /ORGANISM="Bolidomonas pacifica, Strain CCMP 1866" /LENGTH=462 /DNA_ID=CAMNT_0006549293 /DNA_START=132 /DNA_END=1516 /DNA_ORIENTATION=+